MEDLPGNFLLLPPGRGVSGVDAGKVDYLGVYSGATVAAANCESEPVPEVGLKPKSIANALAAREGLKVTAPRAVSIGGRDGLVIDIEVQSGTKAGCQVGRNLTIIPLIIGAGPASLEHAQVPGLQTRLYILDNGRSNIIIEISDVGKDARPFNFEPVLNRFQFAHA